jgi:hypothetical protein
MGLLNHFAKARAALDFDWKCRTTDKASATLMAIYQASVCEVFEGMSYHVPGYVIFLFQGMLSG